MRMRLLCIGFILVLTACSGGGGSSVTPSIARGGAMPAPAGANFGTTLATHYTVIDLGPGAGSPWLTPQRVNNDGVVVLDIGSPLSSLPCANCGGAFPQGFVFKNGALQQLPALPGSSQAYGSDVNNAGDIVGGSFNASGAETAVLWKPDLSIVNLGTGIASLNGSAEADAISDSGKIAGASYNASAVLPTFFDGKGGATDPCGSSVQGYFRAGVNDAGVAAGDELLSAGGTAAMTCPPFAAVATPSDPSWLDFGFDINNAGVVVGRMTVGPTPAVFHPFMYQNGKLTDLGTLFPNTASSVGAAFGMNNDGMIVGFSAQSGGTIGNPPVPPVNPRAWVYANGKMVDLNTLLPASCANWTLITAEDISDNGDIVGVAFVGGYPNGQEHAYLLKPQP